MAESLPYLASYKNVDLLFDKIMAAQQPPAFTNRFLGDTLGLKSSGDRQLITLLKSLGFLDSAGKPTSEYGFLKNKNEAPRAIAAAVKRAFAPLFAANENAHELDGENLKGLVAQITGGDKNQTSKTVGTLKALLNKADFSKLGNDILDPLNDEDDEEEEQEIDEPERAKEGRKKNSAASKSLRPEFHYNLQIHLPSNASEEVYLRIFNAIRKTFQ